MPFGLHNWGELSALYDLAEGVEGPMLEGWLRALPAGSRMLIPQLRRMLEVRASLVDSQFLLALPALDVESCRRAPEPREGMRVGPYALLRQLGAGGAADVWLGRRSDGAFERTVAVKLLFKRPALAQRDVFAERFRRERDILASLDHPNIARLHDAGITQEGQAWLALEYIEGLPITEWCDSKRMPVKERIAIFRQALLAVEYAHAHLIIHRDVKPANILVTNGGSVHLLDFGIAKLMSDEHEALADTELTLVGGRPLTLAYASPEQVLGHPLTTSCDVYSLGVLLYELACGQRPYQVRITSAARIEEAILEVDPEAPSRRSQSRIAAEARDTEPKGLARTLSGDFDAIVLKALQKTPGRRYPSVETLRLELDRWLAREPVLAQTPTRRYRAWRFLSRHRVGATAVGVASFALLSVAAAAIYLGFQARQEAARAIASRDVLVDMFRQADPDQTRGGDITAREILESGRKRVDTTLGGQPQLQAELLTAIGGIQRTLGEGKQAQATFGRAAEIYERIGNEREAVLAELSRANEVLRMGDYDQADQIVKRVQERVGRIANDNQVRVPLLRMSGLLAWQQKHYAEAETLLRGALRATKDLYGPRDLHTLEMLSNLASLESERSRFALARGYADEAAQQERFVPELTGTQRINIELQQAKIESLDGWYDRARRLFSQSIESCRASLGANNEWCLLLSMRQAEVLLRLGRNSDALTLLPTLSAWYDLDKVPRRQAESLTTACRILAANGRLPVDDPLRLRLVTFGRSGQEVRQSEEVKIKALFAAAEAYVREGDGANAMKVLEEASRRITLNHELRDDALIVGRHALLNGLSLQLQGNHAEALEQLDFARKSYGGVLGNRNTLVAIVDLDRVLSLRALGRLETAMKTAQISAATLREHLDVDAPILKSSAAAFGMPGEVQRRAPGSRHTEMFFT